MRNYCPVAIATATATLSAALLLAPAPGQGRAPGAASADDAARAKRIAERFERDARVLTVFDRQGKVVTTVGERALYFRPVFSPDRTRLAVTKIDLASETEDVWVLDVATGASIRITSSRPHEKALAPNWSPDGSRVSYAALRGSYWGLYRKASNGEGVEELLYQHPGANMTLADWSMDGRFLSFSSTDLSGGILCALPLGAGEARTPIEIFRSEAQLEGPRLSPDDRFLSYASNQSGRNEVYVRPFDRSADVGAQPTEGPWQVSDQGLQVGQGPVFWREDGKELFYVAADSGVMAVKITTAPSFEFGKPTLLFRLSEAVPVTQWFVNVSRDGQFVVIAVPHAPTLQQIAVFDCEQQLLLNVGEPGRFQQPMLSPNGRHVAAVRIVPQTGNEDIWAFDVASGQGRPVTSDTFSADSPVWSPDGREIAYVSRRGNYSNIYRKSWDGTGPEVPLFQYTPGAGMQLTDWSADGQLLIFQDDCAGVLYAVPLGGAQNPLERKAIEWLRDEYNVGQARLSPDSRLMAYLSDEIEAETFEAYVRPFDPTKTDVSAGGTKPVRVSTAGARGMMFWRQDGKQLYFLTPEWEVMAADVTSSPTLQVGTPRLLLKLPGPLAGGGPQQWSNVSRDGQRFVFTINVPVSVTAR